MDIGDYYAFCYLLPIYSLHYYFGILHRYPYNITISCLHDAPTGQIEPGASCKSKAIPTELCGPLSITLFKDVYELNDVSNHVILMIIRLSVP